MLDRDKCSQQLQMYVEALSAVAEGRNRSKTSDHIEDSLSD